MATITPNKLWFYKQDLKMAANRLEAIMDTMKASDLHMIEMQDLPPVVGWLEDLETIVNGLVAKKEKTTSDAIKYGKILAEGCTGWAAAAGMWRDEAQVEACEFFEQFEETSQ